MPAVTACGGGGGGGGSREAGGAGPSPSSAAEEADGSAARKAGRERLEAAAFEAGGTAASYQVSPDDPGPVPDDLMPAQWKAFEKAGA
ncbi:hypothetical protein [Streptomyces sp. KL2]|uniref:hypothetical protein n=1 Tax=Streptomyces sp. KL2 TaxID=3050126 RepID=UPI00397958E8